MLETTDDANPVQPPGQQISNNFVSETNLTLGIGLPEHTYHIELKYDLFSPPNSPLPLPPNAVLFPKGTVFTLKSSDPGRILTTGDPCELPLACIINSDPQQNVFATTSFFRASSLWGVANTAPYFHDNSAATLDDVMNRYQDLFAITAAGLGNSAFVITAQDREDIIAYTQYAFRRDKP